MTIVTFLGMIGVKQNGEGEMAIPETFKAASYRFSPALTHALGASGEPMSYANMLPLLLERFPKARVIAVGTETSHAAQAHLLVKKYPHLAERRYDKVVLEDAHDYHAIFRKMGDVLEEDEALVVDISHSFRHLPSLMMVDMVIENVKNPGRIRHILFAKELEPGKRYVIVDLREYLTLANVSYALASFTKNYTVAISVRTVEEVYQALLNELSVFSEHMLANSFEALLRDGEKYSVTRRILETLELVKRHERTKDLIHPLVPYLEKISAHMKEILSHASDPADERLYFFANLMFDKGYLLNALTLLDEAAAAYCVEGFRKKPAVKESLETFERAIENRDNEKIYNRYELTSMAKNIVKLGRNFKKYYNGKLASDAKIAETFIDRARSYVNEHYWRMKSLRDFLYDCDTTRNNLAHANSDKRLDEVKKDIRDLLTRYEKVCQVEDPLGRYST
ncbi:TM1812 family CRISPR-associated protein [Hydrogenimonas cancrithermarum]|uniref:Uncharacterized protein n=1 Tax=Hydrogenimonas cancrithermarum TaxID=2993563 RepID=A0ABM8FI63_9BACT|nr:TM1812 family CRISPR-associated protein [Hydrogenimonas cancrithermarum]BDY11975.1 hypothetical protein HCR_02870 [Hydrogenimonas cancrithermarum]